MAYVLIAGCGDVGTKLGMNLFEAGHRVWGLKRDPSSLPSALEAIQADLSKPASLARLPKADYVFYTAAAGAYRAQRYRAVYADGVAHLLDALSKPLQRFFFVSSTSVYGQQKGEWVDEDSPAEASGFAASCLRAGERLAWDSPFPATVVRFAGIYGPGRTRLIDSVRSGNARCRDGVYTNRIHRDDCARALQHLMQLGDPAALYLGVDDAPAAQCEVLGWLAERLKVAAPRHHASVDGGARPRSNKRCRNTRLRASGFRFRYPSYQDGYAELLKDAALALPERAGKMRGQDRSL